MNKKHVKSGINVFGVGTSIMGVLLLSTAAFCGGFSGDKAGTTVMQFLNLGCGARAAGMGEAYCAVADDTSALYWNPAGISRMRTAELSLSHSIWLADVNYSFAGFALPVGKHSGFGASLTYLSMDSMEKLDNTGSNYGSFRPYDMAGGLSYSIGSEHLSAGLTVKYISQNIDDTDIESAAADIGVLWLMPGGNTRLGGSIRNIGPKASAKSGTGSAKYALPLTARAGISRRILDSLSVSADAIMPVDADPSGAVGLEYKLDVKQHLGLAVRAGYQTETAGNFDSLSGLSAGAGVSINGLGFDYAWTPYGELGSTHKISMKIAFNTQTRKVVSAAKEPKISVKKGETSKGVQIAKAKTGRYKKIYRVNKRSQQ